MTNAVEPITLPTIARITFEVVMADHENVPERDGIVGAWYNVFSPRSASVVLDGGGQPVEVEVSGPRVSQRRAAIEATDQGRAWFGRSDLANLDAMPAPVRMAVFAAQARFDQAFPGIRS